MRASGARVHPRFGPTMLIRYFVPCQRGRMRTANEPVGPRVGTLVARAQPRGLSAHRKQST
jgi:hypothetical protein